METNSEILNELNALSPTLAGMRNVNVFSVPTGYFDSISDTVIACLNVGEPTQNQDERDVPAGYFDNLAGSVLNRIRAAEGSLEDNEKVSPVLASLRDRKVFEVPNGYFENNVTNLLSIVTTQDASDELRSISPLLYSIQNEQVFTVPAGYFENNVANLLNIVNTEDASNELRSISPLLYSIQNEEVFTVPAWYFESVTMDILDKVKPAAAKTVQMPRRKLVARYAIAAMMVGLAAFGVIKFADTNRNPGNSPQVAVMDASIEKGRKMNDQQFNEALKNLSTADIASYLEQNGDITDITALGNNVDESTLPNLEDYLLDEKTLDNYLQQIESSPLNN